ncbi:hypothetical protein V8D89_001945 [Ganoderma adspersum]
MSEVAIGPASPHAHLGHSAVDTIGPNNDPGPRWHVPAPPPLNHIRQEIQDHLDLLEIKEEEIRRERLELRSRWNRSLAVTQLPNEILFHIFVDVSQQPKPPSMEDYRDDEDNKNDGSSEFGLAKTGWAKLMLVCRRWHDVAHATPALWRTIDVRKTPSWMKLALTRSGSATLDVSFPSHFSEEHASLLQPHCHRLRSFRLRSWSLYALRVIRNTLPALETLEIHNNPEGMKAATKGFYTDLGITRRRLPNLHALRLAYTLIPRDPLFYARLRKLSLKACPLKATVEQFVQLLATDLSLEHLELDEFLQQLSDSGDVGAPASPLPSLLSLRLSNHIPVHSARFLSQVLIPQTASLEIEALAEEEREITLRALVPPNVASSLPRISTVAWARLVITCDEYAIECPSMQLEQESDETMLVKLAFTSSPGPDWSDSMPGGLADLLALFGSAPLTHLELFGDSSAVAAETWTALFRAFPALVSLEAEADGALFTCLHEASLSNSADEEVACRGLERIVLNDDWGVSGRLEWVLDPLIRCLRYRAEKGSRLQELCLALPQDLSALKVYLAQLEELVPNLELGYAYALGPSESVCHAYEDGSDEEGEERDDDSETQDGSDNDHNSE